MKRIAPVCVNTDLITAKSLLMEYVAESEYGQSAYASDKAQRDWWSGPLQHPPTQTETRMLWGGTGCWECHWVKGKSFELALVPFRKAPHTGETVKQNLNMMQVRVMPTKPGRIQIDVAYKEPEGTDVTDTLIAAMKQWWPSLALGPPQHQGLSERVNSSEHVSYFPTTERARALWGIRWKLMCELDVKARARYEAGKRDNQGPSPSWNDYIRSLALHDGTGKALKERTVRYIKEAGEKGLLT